MKENVTPDTLLGPQSEQAQLPFEPIYDYTIQGSSAQSKLERLARNAQLKMN